MWRIVLILAIIRWTSVLTGQDRMRKSVLQEELIFDRETSQKTHDHVVRFKPPQTDLDEKSVERTNTDDEKENRNNTDYSMRENLKVFVYASRKNDNLTQKWNDYSKRLKHVKRQKRQVPQNGTDGYTCNLYLQSDPLLWRHIKKKMLPGGANTDELIRQNISAMFSSHVKVLNDIFLQTTFNTYNNTISYRGINFKIARINIMTDISEKCGQVEASSWCKSSASPEQMLQLLSKENHGAFCLAYVFTYREGVNGLSFLADPKAVMGGICSKFKSGFAGNTGIVNLYRLESNISSLVFAHEMGHSFGSAHDRGSTCLPDDTDERDDSRVHYLMNPNSVFQNKELNYQFSPCSRDSIARVLDTVINERNTRTNCLIQKRIVLPLRSTSVSTLTPTLPSFTHLSPSTSATSPRQYGNRWTIGVASTVILVFVCLAMVFPYVLWRRRVVFLMKLVHRFQTYEDNDEREFDAFISYRSTEEDEHFVVHTLFPKLEKQLKFKICVHFRDFMPGETIANNIIWGIESSRRTIMVLTPSYIKSEFCRFEYQRAQHEMLKQKQRIIPIILKDISSVTNDMDETLKTILSSITYIQWPGSSDKGKVDAFWEKLIFSMPKLQRNLNRVSMRNSVTLNGWI